MVVSRTTVVVLPLHLLCSRTLLALPVGEEVAKKLRSKTAAEVRLPEIGTISPERGPGDQFLLGERRPHVSFLCRLFIEL